MATENIIMAMVKAGDNRQVYFARWNFYKDDFFLQQFLHQFEIQPVALQNWKHH